MSKSKRKQPSTLCGRCCAGAWQRGPGRLCKGAGAGREVKPGSNLNQGLQAYEARLQAASEKKGWRGKEGVLGRLERGEGKGSRGQKIEVGWGHADTWLPSPSLPPPPPGPSLAL